MSATSVVDARLRPHGLHRVPEYRYQVGNCLFDSIAYVASAILGQELEASALRAQAMNLLERAYADYVEVGAQLGDVANDIGLLELNNADAGRARTTATLLVAQAAWAAEGEGASRSTAQLLGFGRHLGGGILRHFRAVTEP